MLRGAARAGPSGSDAAIGLACVWGRLVGKGSGERSWGVGSIATLKRRIGVLVQLMAMMDAKYVQI